MDFVHNEPRAASSSTNRLAILRRLVACIMLSSNACGFDQDISFAPVDMAQDAYDAAAHVHLLVPQQASKVLFVPSSGIQPLSGGERNTTFLALAMDAIGFDTMALAGSGAGLDILARHGVRTFAYDSLDTSYSVPSRLPEALAAGDQALRAWQQNPFDLGAKQAAIAAFAALRRSPQGAPLDMATLLQKPRGQFDALFYRSEILRQFLATHRVHSIVSDYYMDTLAALIATQGSDTRVILYVQSSDKEHYDDLLSREVEVIACSSASAKRFAGPTHLAVVTNGINLRKFKPSLTPTCTLKQSMQLPCDARLVGHTGYIGHNKNQGAIVRAAIEVSKTVPDLHVVLVGATILDPDYAQVVKHIAEDGHFSNHVHFLGNRSDIPSVLQALDLFVFPSHQEGFGLSLAEAMATGIASIANDIAPFRSFVGSSVRLVDVTHTKALAAQMQEILTDEALARSLGAQARRQVIDQQLTTESMAEGFARFLGAEQKVPCMLMQRL